jgi:hypothetical protein
MRFGGHTNVPSGEDDVGYIYHGEEIRVEVNRRKVVVEKKEWVECEKFECGS